MSLFFNSIKFVFWLKLLEILGEYSTASKVLIAFKCNNYKNSNTIRGHILFSRQQFCALRTAKGQSTSMESQSKSLGIVLK